MDADTTEHGRGRRRRLKNDVEQKHEWKFDDWKGERRKESGREGRRDKELERTSLRRFGGTDAHVDAAGAQSCPVNFLVRLVILLDFA